MATINRVDPLAYLAVEIDALKTQGVYRQLRVLDDEQRAHTVVDGRSAINLSSNNYLGLTTHPRLREKAIEAIVGQAKERWNIYDALVIHRVGRLHPTDQIVLVVVTSAHRGDAFAACEFIMDYLKTRAPFWKKEQSGAGARWVEARTSDDVAADRWR